MNLNGQEYESYYLTPKEKAVVDAMRMGATLDVSIYVDCKQDPIEKVDKFFSCFDVIKGGYVSVYDRSDFEEVPYVGFVKFYSDSDLRVSASVILERVVG